MKEGNTLEQPTVFQLSTLSTPVRLGPQLVLESARANAERFRPELFARFGWPLERMLAESPVPVADLRPDEQFRAWLRLWPPESVVWIGEVYSSGRPEHRAHFRPVAEWERLGPVLGNFTWRLTRARFAAP